VPAVWYLFSSFSIDTYSINKALVSIASKQSDWLRLGNCSCWSTAEDSTKIRWRTAFLGIPCSQFPVPERHDHPDLVASGRHRCCRWATWADLVPVCSDLSAHHPHAFPTGALFKFVFDSRKRLNILTKVSVSVSLVLKRRWQVYSVRYALTWSQSNQNVLILWQEMKPACAVMKHWSADLRKVI